MRCYCHSSSSDDEVGFPEKFELFGRFHRFTGRGPTRRRFLAATGALGLCVRPMSGGQAQQEPRPHNLLSAPLEIVGEWNGSPPNAAANVIARVREITLAKL